MKTILVTGATGFLGKHLLKQLRQEEPAATLRLLCRGVCPWEGEPQVEVARGDITSAQQVARATEGVQQVYHLAGFVERDPGDATRLYETHVAGTRNVCEAMLRHQVRKGVLVSTSGTVAVGLGPVERDETSGYAEEVVEEWPYYLSKIEAEKLAFEYVANRQLPVVVVNPSLLLGPGDDRLSSTRDMVLFLEGQIMVIPTGGLNLVDVRDVAAGLIAAMKRGRGGERYLLGGPNWSFREWIDRVSRLTGLKPPSLQPPLKLSLLGAWVARRLFPLVGKQFKLDDASIKMSALYWYCNSEKARRELGFTTRDPMETLRDTLEDIYQRNPALRPGQGSSTAPEPA